MEGGQVAVMSDGITNFRQQLPFPPSPRAGAKEGIKRLDKDSKIAAGNVMPFARSGLGVAVRKGAPKPGVFGNHSDPAAAGFVFCWRHALPIYYGVGPTPDPQNRAQ